MEKYPRGMQGPVSIPLLIKAQMVFGEKPSLCCVLGLTGQDAQTLVRR